MSTEIAIDPTTLGRIMGALGIGVVIAIIYFLEIRPNMQISAKYKKKKMQYEADKARIEAERGHYVHGRCAFCRGDVTNTDDYDYECGNFYHYAVCDNCKAVYLQRVIQDKHYPPEVQALIDEHPEYQAVDPRDFFPQLYWNDLTMLDKQRVDGDISEEWYRIEYMRIIDELKFRLENMYSEMKSKEAIAARPPYNPADHSPY